jgi:hypothetical protein
LALHASTSKVVTIRLSVAGALAPCALFFALIPASRVASISPVHALRTEWVRALMCSRRHTQTITELFGLDLGGYANMRSGGIVRVIANLIALAGLGLLSPDVWFRET